MLKSTLQSLAAAAKGTLVSGEPDALIRGHFSDTRTPAVGGLFVALRGERFDGNTFLRQAIAACGAAAVLFDRPEFAKDIPAGAGGILVKDSRAGFLGIASAHRAQLADAAWIGVTGSVGKSTTKEMIAHVLGVGASWNVHKAQGSFNNAVGLSHTILGAAAEHRAVVLELGTNHPGEIRQLAAIARPVIAAITCAGESHLEAFRTVGNVALEKADILKFQQEGDVAVLNCDDRHFGIWRDLARGSVISYGQSERALLRATNIKLGGDGCASFTVHYGIRSTECALRVPGQHQIGNALCAIGVALAAGVRLETAANAMGTFTGIARRFTIRQCAGVTLIDDAYNANPASFNAALDTLAAYTSRKKFVVAGDMLELGEESARCHSELGEKLAGVRIDGLFTVGESSTIAGTAAVEGGLPRESWTHCPTPEQAAEALRPHLQSGDVVLIKGSHGVHLERCCEALVPALEGRAAQLSVA